MGLLRKIGKAIKKGVKDVGKVAKKVAPVALALTGVGGVVGGVATTALKAASKLKSTGQNLKKAGFQQIKPIQTVAAIKKAVAPGAATRAPSRRAAKPKKKKTTTRRKKKKAPPAGGNGFLARFPDGKVPEAVLKVLYSSWKETDQSMPWPEYAKFQLGG